jgi:hypothetical protein
LNEGNGIVTQTTSGNVNKTTAENYSLHNQQQRQQFLVIEYAFSINNHSSSSSAMAGKIWEDREIKFDVPSM